MFFVGQSVIVNSPSNGLINKRGVLVKLVLEATPGTPELWDVDFNGSIIDCWENEMEPSDVEEDSENPDRCHAQAGRDQVVRQGS